MKPSFVVEIVPAAPTRQGQLTLEAFTVLGPQLAVTSLSRRCGSVALRFLDRHPAIIDLNLAELPAGDVIVRFDAHGLAKQCELPCTIARHCGFTRSVDELPGGFGKLGSGTICMGGQHPHGEHHPAAYLRDRPSPDKPPSDRFI